MAKGYGRPPMSRKGGKAMGGMPGINMDMIKQAQKMQADMEKKQAELQDMVIAAVNEAIRAAMDDMSSTMSQLTSGLNLPF